MNVVMELKHNGIIVIIIMELKHNGWIKVMFADYIYYIIKEAQSLKRRFMRKVSPITATPGKECWISD